MDRGALAYGILRIKNGTAAAFGFPRTLMIDFLFHVLLASFPACFTGVAMVVSGGIGYGIGKGDATADKRE